MSDDEIIVTCDIGDEIFFHNLEGTFNISAIKRALPRLDSVKVARLDLRPDLVEHCKRNDPNRDRIESIKANDKSVDDPIICMFTVKPDNVLELHVLDGTHRVIARSELGLDYVMAYPLCRELAQYFRVDNIPDLDIVGRDRDSGRRLVNGKPE